MSLDAVANINLPEDIGGVQKAEFCRKRAAALFAAADRALGLESRADLVATAQKWTALASYYEKQADRQ